MTKAFLPSYEFRSLRWYLRGSISDSIYVLRDATDANSPLDPYQTADGDNENPVADASVAEAEQSHVTVSVMTLDDFPEHWVEFHEGLCQPEETSPGVDFDDNGELLQCVCGSTRPPPGPTLEVSAEPGQFITIGQYVREVHPWLMSLAPQMRLAKGIEWQDGEPLDDSDDLWVHNGGIESLMIQDSVCYGPDMQAYYQKTTAEAPKRSLLRRRARQG